MTNFDILNSCDPVIIEASNWAEVCQRGWLLPSDGTSFWGTVSHYNYDYDGFQSKPDHATHVHWFSK